MKSLKLLSSLVIGSLISVKAFAAPTVKPIDTKNTEVVYLAKKIGGQHTGKVAVKSGELTFDKDLLAGGTVVIDMKSITVTDIADAGYMKKYLDHINSDDFFMTSKFSTSTLKIKSVKKVKGSNHEISGDLTIKDKTHPVTFTADIMGNKAVAKIIVDRTLYDIKYNSIKFFSDIADKAIEDTFELNVNLAWK